MVLRVLPHRNRRNCIVISKARGRQTYSFGGRDHTMPQSTVEMAKELTMALIHTWSIPPDRMQETLQQTYTTVSPHSRYRKRQDQPPQCPLSNHRQWTGEQASPDMPLRAWNAGKSSNSGRFVICGYTGLIPAPTGQSTASPPPSRLPLEQPLTVAAS
jgi:hypothetical protein